MSILRYLSITSLFVLAGCEMLREGIANPPKITTRDYALRVEECYAKPENYRFRTEPRRGMNFWSCFPDKSR